MSFFSASNLKVSIDFANNNNGNDSNAFVVGGDLTGVVTITTSAEQEHPIKLCGASLQYRITQFDTFSRDPRYTRIGPLRYRKGLLESHEAKKNNTSLSSSSSSSSSRLDDSSNDSLRDRREYNVEHVLFGSHNRFLSSPLASSSSTSTTTTTASGSTTAEVHPGVVYKYPFSIPIPPNAPPTTRFGLLSDGGVKLCGALNNGPQVAIDHKVRVTLYVANSLANKRAGAYVPSVLKTVAAAAATSGDDDNDNVDSPYRDVLPVSKEQNSNNNNNTCSSGSPQQPQQHHVRHIPKNGVWGTISGALHGYTKTRFDCDVTVTNTVVVLGEDGTATAALTSSSNTRKSSHDTSDPAANPTIDFMISGLIDGPYQVHLARRTTFHPVHRVQEHVVAESAVMDALLPLDTPPPSASASSSSSYSHSNSPPCSATTSGTLHIDPNRLEHCASFTTKEVTVEYFLTLNAVTAATTTITAAAAAAAEDEKPAPSTVASSSIAGSFPHRKRLDIPITIVHATTAAQAGVTDDYDAAALTVAPPDGAVVPYEVPLEPLEPPQLLPLTEDKNEIYHDEVADDAEMAPLVR